MKKMIIQTIKTYKGSISSISICILTIGLIRQLFPVLFGNLIQSVSGKLDIKKTMGIVLCYSCLFICAQLLHVIENITYADLFNNMLISIRKECFHSFLNATRKSVDKKAPGEIITIINEDVDKILDFINNCIINFGSMSIELIVIIAFTMIINPYLAIYIVICVFFSFVISKNAGKIVKKLYEMQRQNKSETISFVIDVMEGRQDIVFMNAFSSINNLYVKTKMKQLDTEYRIYTRNIVIERVNAFTSVICNIGLMGLSCYFIANARMTMGNFITCTLYFETALAMMNFYGYLAHAIPESQVSINRVIDFIGLEMEKHGIQNIDSINKIDLNNLSFSFDETNDLAEIININVKKRELLYVEGESGVGKTTLIKCILGLYDDYKGNIYFNDIEMRDTNKFSVRERISVCLQGDELLEGETLRDNLCMGEKIEESQIMQVLEKVNIKDFVVRQQNGLDTVFAKEYLGMSGGQKQRLLLARTLLKDADVYVFDEPAAALDSENEKKINDILMELKQKKIVIVTSHRPMIKSIADKTLKIKKKKRVKA